MLYVAWKSTYQINRSLRVNHVVVSHVHTDESGSVDNLKLGAVFAGKYLQMRAVF